MQTQDLTSVSHRARSLDASKIRVVAEHGMKMNDVLPLWFGEGAWPTPTPIVDAAITALQSGVHRYQPNNGSPALREQVCLYSNQLFGSTLTPERVTVTPSGMQGLMLSAQLLVTPGDRVVMLEPGWPNIVECYKSMGAAVHQIPLMPKNGRWDLDLDQLIDSLSSNTQIFVVNSPNNPTGWVMSAEAQRIVLNHCRKHGIWIVSDDVYSRLYRHAQHAPSFLSIADDNDRIVSVNSFSKSWSMTGWRLGWMIAPAEFEHTLGHLTEFNTSCTTGFVQAGGQLALRDGEDDLSVLRQRIQTGYKITANALTSFSKVDFIEPDGAFYVFFRVEGLTDSFSAAMDILSKTKVGLAPGIAFGQQGEGYLRMCFAQPKAILEEAFERLQPVLE